MGRLASTQKPREPATYTERSGGGPRPPPRESQTPPRSPGADAAALVRRLVACGTALPHRSSYGRGRLDGRPVLLDIEVDGVRCMLLGPLGRSGEGEHTLSPREQEIARMIAQGYPNKTIAAVLDISAWTVSTYLRRIFAKLGVRSRAAMVARVLEEGLVHDEPPPQVSPRDQL